MKPLYFLFCLVPISALGQIVSFQKKADTIYVELGKPFTYASTVVCEGCDKEAEFSLARDSSSTMPAENTTIQQSTGNFKLSEQQRTLQYFFTVVVANATDFGKTVNLRITRNGVNSYSHIYILAKQEPNKPDSNRYRMLIGTNFDFVDGVKAKDLYYHLQFFVPDAFSGDKWGFVGGIQQNRQVSQLDTSVTHYYRAKGYFADSFRLMPYTHIGEDSFRMIRTGQVTYDRITTSNVLQLYIQPTRRIWVDKLKNSESRLYLLGHADLQYRRVRYEQKHNFSVRDTVTVGRASFSKYAAIGEKVVTTENQYYFNYGLGVMLHHQNKYVDMYTKLLFGLSSINMGDTRGFYATEIGVRVVNFNVMLGAEYRGLFSEHAPQYLNVYLSKAFSLSKLADLIAK